MGERSGDSSPVGARPQLYLCINGVRAERGFCAKRSTDAASDARLRYSHEFRVLCDIAGLFVRSDGERWLVVLPSGAAGGGNSPQAIRAEERACDVAAHQLPEFAEIGAKTAQLRQPVARAIPQAALKFNAASRGAAAGHQQSRPRQQKRDQG